MSFQCARRASWLAFAPLVSLGSLAALAGPYLIGKAAAAEPVSPSDTGLVPLGAEVSLADLLAHAQTHAPLLLLDAANDARIRAARAAAGRALPDNPELWVGGGPRVEGSDIGVDFEVGVSQRFEVGGERAARLRVAAAVRKSIEAESLDRRWDLHTTVHALFYQALVARERVLLATRAVAFQDEIATIVGKQAKAGSVAELAVRVAQAESASARAELATLIEAELAVRQDIALVIGWAPDAPPRPRGDLRPLATLPALADLLALAAANRPDIAVLDAAIIEARAQVRAADRDKTPEPTIGLSWSRESAPTGGDAAHVVIATFALPLPLVVNNEQERAEARAALEIALAERQRAEAEIASQVTRAYRAATSATRRLDAFGSEVLPRFEENLTALRRAYEIGDIDILGLTTARERFLTAQRDALTVQEDYFNALAELEHAVGIDVIDATKENK